MGKWFSYHSNFGMWYIYSGLVHYYNPGHGTKCNLSCYNYIGSRDKKIKEPDVFNSLIVNLLLSKPSLDEKTLLNTWSFKHRQCIYKRLKGHNAHLSTNCKIFLSTQPYGMNKKYPENYLKAFGSKTLFWQTLIPFTLECYGPILI